MNSLITRSELARRTDGELAALFLRVSQGLARLAPGTDAHRKALGSLDNIARERAARARQPRP
jgi:hypothetical protein